MKYKSLPINDKSWLWFDLDDTLYDFSASSKMALAEMFTRFRLDRFFENAEHWSDVYHRHNDRLWERYNAGEIDQQTLRRDRFLLPLLEMYVPRSTAEELTGSLDSEYLASLARTGLTISFAAELLGEARKRGYKIGILSNGFVDVQYEKLRNSGLDVHTDCVVLSDEIGINKPDRRLFDYALSKAGTDASSSVMIGDNPSTDIEGALKAGWTAILFDPRERHADTPVSRITSLNPQLFFQ